MFGSIEFFFDPKLTENYLAKNSRKVSNILNENNFSNEDCILILRTILNRSKSEEVFQKIYGSASESQSLTVEQSLETLSKAITPWSSDIEFMFVGLMLAFNVLSQAFI